MFREGQTFSFVTLFLLHIHTLRVVAVLCFNFSIQRYFHCCPSIFIDDFLHVYFTNSILFVYVYHLWLQGRFSSAKCHLFWRTPACSFHHAEMWNEKKEVKYLNLLKGAVDHCNEHVEQYNDHSDVIHSIEHITGVLNEFVSVVHNHWLDLRESKNGPKQCFEAFFYAVGFVRGTKRIVNMVHTLYIIRVLSQIHCIHTVIKAIFT